MISLCVSLSWPARTSSQREGVRLPSHSLMCPGRGQLTPFQPIFEKRKKLYNSTIPDALILRTPCMYVPAELQHFQTIWQEVRGELRLISGQYETWQAWGTDGNIWCVIKANLHHNADCHVLLVLLTLLRDKNNLTISLNMKEGLC